MTHNVEQLLSRFAPAPPSEHLRQRVLSKRKQVTSLRLQQYALRSAMAFLLFSVIWGFTMDHWTAQRMACAMGKPALSVQEVHLGKFAHQLLNPRRTLPFPPSFTQERVSILASLSISSTEGDTL